MNPPEPLRGEVWDLDLNPITGREQAGFRPALVLSVDLFSVGPAELVVVVPFTRTQRKVRWHVPVRPPGGLAAETLEQVEDRVRILLGL